MTGVNWHRDRVTRRTSPKQCRRTKKSFDLTWQEATAGLGSRGDQPLVLLFQDEARFGRISEARRRCWAPFPQRPHAARQVVRQYVYAVAAVSPLDGRLCSLVLPWMNAQTMSLFLRHAARSFAPEHCVMFLDQAGWHLAAELRVPRRIHLCSLPAHSPELNPVEGLWKHIRQNYFGQSALDSLQEVEERLCRAFHALDQQPEVIKSLCGYGWIRAISTRPLPPDPPQPSAPIPPT